MKRSAATSVVAFKEEQLLLRCEWDQCNFSCQDSPQYYQHVRKHFDNDLAFVDSNVCPWTDCAASLKSTKELRTHVFYHAFHSKIKCYGQNFLGRQKTALRCLVDKQSRNIIADTPEQYECQWTDCDNYFENPDAFYEHVNVHAEEARDAARSSGKPSQQCGWSSCDASFATVYKLKEHLRTHTQEKRLACPNCGGVFWSRTKLLDHFARQDEQTSLTCSYCSRGFSSERLLRDHMRHHVNQYKCPLCDMTFPAPSAVRYHVQWRHSSLRPYACDQCDYAAKQPSDLRKHLEWHDDSGKPCPYPGCEFVERSSYLLRNHIRSEHLKCPKSVYMCHICQKQYAKGNSLSRHLVSQHRFQWPPGHTRFAYTCNKDNIFTVQTFRYESIELAQATEVIPKEMSADTVSTLSEPTVLASASVPVVLVGSGTEGSQDEVSEQPIKLVQIVQRNEDGSTVVQMAQVLAEQPPLGLAESLQTRSGGELGLKTALDSDVQM